MRWWKNWRNICRKIYETHLDERDRILGDIKVYISAFFEIDEHVIDEFGAVNVSLVNDFANDLYKGVKSISKDFGREK